jgi:hypothetical protein
VTFVNLTVTGTASAKSVAKLVQDGCGKLHFTA